MIARKTYLMLGASGLALTLMPAAASGQEVAAPTSAEQASGDEIVVQGYRQSLETAQAIKKDSDQIVDSIVAEDIGKLPDSTGAETLARVPGVSVERLTGEAAGIRVRGLPDLATTYNGRELFTAEGRFVALQDFPSGTISRFDVYKTGAANLLEPGIAGLVDVRSRKPFDFKELRIAGGITGLHWQNSQKFGVEANLLVSNRWETGIGEIGFLIEGSYTDNKFQDDYRTNSNTPNTQGPGTTANPNPNAGLRYPSVLTLQPDVSNRFRPSGGASLQWRPSPDLEFYSDFLYQGFRGRGQGYGLQINAGTNAVLSNVVLCPGSANLVCSMTANAGTGNAVSAYQAGQFSQTDTYQVGGGFSWKLGNGGRITGDVAFTDSTFTSTNFQVGMTTRTITRRDFQFQTAAGGGTAQVLNQDGSPYDLTDPNNWRYSGFSQANSRNHGRSYQARLDGDFPVSLGIFDKIQAGFRFNDRSADSEAVANNAAGQSLLSGTIDNVPGALLTAAPLQLHLIDPSYKNDPTNHPQTWITPTRQSVIHYADYIRSLANAATAHTRTIGMPARTPSYQANEKSYAAYLQTHYGFEVGGGVQVDGQIGLRAVRTETDIRGLQTVIRCTPSPCPTGVQPIRITTPISQQKSYNDFLPNVSARIRFTPQLQARLAFTMTRTRPSFGQLNPTVSYNTTTNPPTASAGNPELEPIKSKNYDASLEYYFSRSGSATVQVFQRDLKGFINNVTESFTDPELGTFNFTRGQNGEEGRIRGVEVGFRTFLNFEGLPDWAKNFGVLANYTYLDHWNILASSLQGPTSLVRGRQPITNTSNHLVNAQAFYETKKFSARVSYNYRSSYRLYANLVAADGTLPTFVDARGSLDLSAGINPTDNISLTFNVANVLGNPQTNFRQFDALGQTYPWQVNYLETVYRLGMRFRF